MISTLNVDVQHVAGKKITLVDYISRHPNHCGEKRCQICKFNNEQVENIIPGHGPVQKDDKGLRNQLLYFEDLKKAVKKALRGNIGLRESLKIINLDSEKLWRNSDAYSKRNISAAFAELEWED